MFAPIRFPVIELGKKHVIVYKPGIYYLLPPNTHVIPIKIRGNLCTVILHKTSRQWVVKAEALQPVED